MQKPSFYYQYRGYQESIILIPGFATDYRIFRNIDLPYNYILVDRLFPHVFESMILAIFDLYHPNAILGFSMGGFLAAQLPESILIQVEKLTLVGVCEKYHEADILKIKRFIQRGKRGYLKKFYENCFYLAADFQRFLDQCFDDYIDTFDEAYLIDLLDVLKNCLLSSDFFNTHGQSLLVCAEKDNIISKDALDALTVSVSRSQTIVIPNQGHLIDFGLLKSI